MSNNLKINHWGAVAKIMLNS